MVAEGSISDLGLSPVEARTLYCPVCAVTLKAEARLGALVPRCRRCQTALVLPPSESPVPPPPPAGDDLPSEVLDLLTVPSARFGKFVLVSEIARGGTGTVYKAWDTYLFQYVTLKRMPPQQREAPLAGARGAIRLRHPNIVTILDVGRVGTEHFVSTEHLDGRPLSRDLAEARDAGRASPFYTFPRRYLRYLRDVARALHYAHGRRVPIVHCDVKPSNIFIDRSERAYVLDFGLARHPGVPGGEPMIAGTPSYMAPEQAAGGAIDARTDVYGLGAVLYELLTGRPPFTGCLPFVLDDIASAPAPAIAPPPGAEEARPFLPTLERICRRCLEKDPARRFAGANEVADALEAVLQPPARPKRSRLPWLAVAVAIVGIFASIPLLRPASTADRVEALAAGFRPDLALELCAGGAADPAQRARLDALRDECSWMEKARASLVEAVARSRPMMDDGEILRASPTGIVLLRGEKVADLEWADLAPRQILDLADRCLRRRSPAESLGLALFARRARLPDRARSLLRELEGTELQTVAERYRE